MTSASPGARLRATVGALRSAQAESPDLYRFLLGGTVDEETTAAVETDGTPREFLDFCRVLDGVDCGPSVQLFGLEEAMEHQYYCEPVDGFPLPLSPEKLFCVGMVHETPVYLDRAGGAVLGIPGEHRERFEAERLEQLAQGLDAFFLERLTTPEYARLALVDDEMVEHDDWLNLLRQPVSPTEPSARPEPVAPWRST